jgi:small subunit ribosomal protein S13
MVNILGFFLNDKKLFSTELIQIHGLGFSKRKQLCRELGFSKDLRVRDLTEIHVEKTTNWIQRSLTVGSNLKRKNLLNIQSLIDKKTYRGFRHLRKLPTRGQRTRTNRKRQRRSGNLRIKSLQN